MDSKDRIIIPQVAFKGAIDLAGHADLDLNNPDGQARFAEMFDFLNDVLMERIVAGQDPTERAANVIKGAFPGSSVVTGGTSNGGTASQYHPSATQPFTVTVKGTQYDDLPSWLIEEAAKADVTEVWDNRDKAHGTNRPWFRATTLKPGEKDPKAFWPPK